MALKDWKDVYMFLRLLAASAASLVLALPASAQTAMVVLGEGVDDSCSERVTQTLQTVGYQTKSAKVSPVPEGLEVNSALKAVLDAAGADINALVSLNLGPATYGELGVAAYGDIACDAVFLDAGGEAVLARALELGQPIALQAAVILYPETMAGSLAVAMLSGFESIAKPSVAQVAEEVATAGVDAEKTMVIDTKHGYVAIALRDDLAPGHAQRLTELTREGFYDGVVFHRVIDGFMAQTGDPTGTGRGGSEKPDLDPEFSDPSVASFERGTVGMARSQDPASANSQFFIMFDAGTFLDGQYTIVGEVLFGMDAVDQIKRGASGSGTVANPDRMQRVFMLSDEI